MSSAATSTPAARMTRGHGSGTPPLLTSTKTVPNVMATIDPTTIPAGRFLFLGIVMCRTLSVIMVRGRPGQAQQFGDLGCANG
ncbi:hypothetical protein GCM10023176_21990 [Micromonospora coerulea]|uniref:Uncharacterized protein n=1 Tax=Micromonospora coerulea TaxID=47856 RepID=A0ABP8SFA7_9ACTN